MSGRGKAEREGNRRAARRLAELERQERRAAAIEVETIREAAMRQLLWSLLERAGVRDAVPGSTTLVPVRGEDAVTVRVMSRRAGRVIVGVITSVELDARVAAIAKERQ